MLQILLNLEQAPWGRLQCRCLIRDVPEPVLLSGSLAGGQVVRAQVRILMSSFSQLRWGFLLVVSICFPAALALRPRR